MSIRTRTFIIRTFTGLILLLGLPLLVSCGKTGLPQANDPKRNFAWETIEAKPYNKCLAFEGQLSGAYQYLDRVRLELAPIDSPADCPGCPFLPKDDVLLTPKEAGLNMGDGTVTFSYCPRPAKAYRWQVSGISRYSRVPNAVSNDQITLFEEEK